MLNGIVSKHIGRCTSGRTQKKPLRMIFFQKADHFLSEITHPNDHICV